MNRIDQQNLVSLWRQFFQRQIESMAGAKDNEPTRARFCRSLQNGSTAGIQMGRPISGTASVPGRYRDLLPKETHMACPGRTARCQISKGFANQGN